MTDLLYRIVRFASTIHYEIMSWNDSSGTYLTDKELHFLVMGLLGMAMLLVVYPIFKLLSKNHILVVAWIYVFTVMVVVTFAVEIGQWFTGLGTMEMADVTAGLKGFMVMFLIFAFLRGIFLLIFRSGKRRADE